MATVVIAWELGGDYGHLARLLPLAQALREQGHQPVFVVRDLLGAESLLQPQGFTALQAPLWLGRLTQLPSPISYAELLMPVGFLNPRALTGICRAWRQLFQLLKPDLLVLDHAPTALLASRGLGLPRLHFGDGFCMPPSTQPLPQFAWWQAPVGPRLAESEAHVLSQANQVLAALGAPALQTLAQLFDVEAQALCSFDALDPYPPALRAPDTPRLGPVFLLSQGQQPVWPEAPGPRVFAYLKPGYGPLEQVLQALQRVPASILLHLPGAARKTLEQYSQGHLRISTEPLAMGVVSAQCDLALCHGGAGTTALMLLAGKPLALLPMQTEQWMSAHRLQTQGLAAGLLINEVERLPQLLQHVWSEPRYRQAAQAFAEAHRGYRQEDTIAAVLAQCEALLARSFATETAAP